MSHAYQTNIYYHDVDSLGVVYHGNYVKYMEAARTEWFRSAGLGLLELHQQDIFFAVTKLSMVYHSPAFLDDRLQVNTKLVKLKPASLVCEQIISRIGPTPKTVVAGEVVLCCTNQQFKPIRVPKVVVEGVKDRG